MDGALVIYNSHCGNGAPAMSKTGLFSSNHINLGEHFLLLSYDLILQFLKKINAFRNMISLKTTSSDQLLTLLEPTLLRWLEAILVGLV